MRVKVYCFIPAEEAEEVIECGLKLNSRLTKTIMICGAQVPCFEAYLHPKDGAGTGPDDVLVKITLPEGRAYIADNSLLGEARRLYNRSIIPADDLNWENTASRCSSDLLHHFAGDDRTV